MWGCNECVIMINVRLQQVCCNNYHQCDKAGHALFRAISVILGGEVMALLILWWQRCNYCCLCWMLTLILYKHTFFRLPQARTVVQLAVSNAAYKSKSICVECWARSSTRNVFGGWNSYFIIIVITIAIIITILGHNGTNHGTSMRRAGHWCATRPKSIQSCKEENRC